MKAGAGIFGRFSGRAERNLLADRLVDVVKAALIDIDVQVSHRLSEQTRTSTRQREEAITAERALVEATLGAALAQLADGDLSVRIEPASIEPHHGAAENFNRAVSRLEDLVATSAARLSEAESLARRLSDDIDAVRADIDSRGAEIGGEHDAT